MHTLKPQHIPKRWWWQRVPKILAKPFHAEDLDEQPHLVPAHPSSQELGEANSSTQPHETQQTQRSCKFQSRGTITNAILASSSISAQPSRNPCRGSTWGKLVLHPAHLQPCGISQEIRPILAAFRKQLRQRVKPWNSAVHVYAWFSSWSIIKYQEPKLWEQLRLKKKKNSCL